MKRGKAKLVIWIVLLASVFVGGLNNLSGRTDPLLSFSEEHGAVRMQGTTFSQATTQPGLRDLDLVLSLNGFRITSAEQARWAACRHPAGHALPVVVERDGSVHRLELDQVPTFTPVTLLLMLGLGVMYGSLGLLVWFHGDREATANAYTRASILVGIAFLLADTINVFTPPVLHFGYGILWIATYSLLPAALLDFTQRFCRITLLPGRPWLSYKAIYLPGLFVAFVLSLAFVRIDTGMDSTWIDVWDIVFNKIHNVSFLLSFVFLIGCLVYRLRHPLSPAERIRTQWAFYSLLVSVSPFAFLYKAPAAFGQAPLIPLWLAQVFLFLFPVGWAMAVTAYRMFRVEWILSRAIVYAVSTGLVAGLLIGIAVVGFHFHSLGATYSIPLLVVLGVVTAYLLLSGLIGQVHALVDRVLYRDAYDTQMVLGALSRELAESNSEPAIAEILTERLPRALKLTQSLCVVRSQSDYLPIMQVGEEETGPPRLCFAASDLAPPSGLALPAAFRPSTATLRLRGYSHILSLSAADTARGYLLLGEKLSGAPFSIRDIRLLEAFTSQVMISLDNLGMHRELVRTEQVRQELRAAAKILRRIMPRADQLPVIKGYDIAGLSRACKEVGGDYFDVIPAPDGSLALLIFDVSGKGLEAALIVSTLQAACHVLVKTGSSIGELARQVNQILVANTASHTFATGFVAFLDPGTGQLESVNAGHNPPYLVRSGGKLLKLTVGGLPFGILEEGVYPTERTLLLEGDRLYCFTDGVTEAMSRDGEMFGEDRLEALLCSLRSAPDSAQVLDQIEHAVCAWTDKPKDDTGFSHDDFTHLCLSRPGAGA